MPDVTGKRRSSWENEPTSTATQRDTVPSKSLPPLSSLDRMASGEHLGQCPTCGGHRWWDNRPRKALREMSPADPDYSCTECRHGRWGDGRQQDGRRPARKAPEMTAISLPMVPPGVQRNNGRSCQALKRDGTPCRNGAMAGSPFCGPHSTRAGPAAPASNQCLGTTKAGRPCRAGAVRGSEYCPQHQPR